MPEHSGRFSPQFKAEAVQMVIEAGEPAGRRLALVQLRIMPAAQRLLSRYPHRHRERQQVRRPTLAAAAAVCDSSRADWH